MRHSNIFLQIKTINQKTLCDFDIFLSFSVARCPTMRRFISDNCNNYRLIGLSFVKHRRVICAHIYILPTIIILLTLYKVLSKCVFKKYISCPEIYFRFYYYWMLSSQSHYYNRLPTIHKILLAYRRMATNWN